LNGHNIELTSKQYRELIELEIKKLDDLAEGWTEDEYGEPDMPPIPELQKVIKSLHWNLENARFEGINLGNNWKIENEEMALDIAKPLAPKNMNIQQSLAQSILGKKKGVIGLNHNAGKIIRYFYDLNKSIGFAKDYMDDIEPFITRHISFYWGGRYKPMDKETVRKYYSALASGAGYKEVPTPDDKKAIDVREVIKKWKK
jgi:hypothetical protein